MADSQEQDLVGKIMSTHQLHRMGYEELEEGATLRNQQLIPGGAHILYTDTSRIVTLKLPYGRHEVIYQFYKRKQRQS